MLKFKMMRKFLAIIMMWAGLIACSDDKDAVLLRKLLIQMG